MAIDPAEIKLDESQRKRLAEMAERTGRPWSELLNEALGKIAREDEQSGTRLRQILDSLSEPLQGVPADELESVMDEATQYARHGKS
jgi:hypothetical protein